MGIVYFKNLVTVLTCVRTVSKVRVSILIDKVSFVSVVNFSS